MFFRKRRQETFLDRGYYSKDREENNSPLRQTLGFAGLAGIVAVAVKAAPSFLPFARGLQTFGRLTTIARGFREGFTGTARRLGASMAFEESLSSEMQFMVTAGEELSRSIASAQLAHRRIQGFLGHLRHHASDPEAFARAEKDLIPLLGEIGQVNHSSQISPDFLSKRSIQRIVKTLDSHGVQLLTGERALGGTPINPDDYLAHKRLFKRAVGQAENAVITKREISEFGEENKRQLLDFIDSARSERRKESETFKKIFRPKTMKGYKRELTGADLMDDPHARTLFNRYYARLTGEDRDFAQELIDRAKRSANSFRSSETEENTLADELMDRFRKTRTGLFVVQERGRQMELVSLNRPKNQILGALSNLASNMQIPLLPGVMHIPADLGSFLRAARTVPEIRNLGLVSNLGELRRLGITAAKQTAHAFESAGKVLIINPGEGEDIGKAKFQKNVQVKVFDKRASTHIDEMSQIRGFDRPWTPFKFREKIGRTHWEDAVLSSQDRLTEYGYISNVGFVVRPKYGIGAGVIEEHIGAGAVDPDMLDPRKLHRFIKDQRLGDRDSVNPGHLLEALRSIAGSAGNVSVDLTGDVRTLGEVFDTLFTRTSSEIPREGFIEDALGGYRSRLRMIMENAHNPEEVVRLAASALGEVQGFRATTALAEETTMLYHQASPELYRALQSVPANVQDFLKSGPGEGGMLHEFATNLFGYNSTSPATSKLHQGILAELVHSKGLEAVDRYIGSEAVQELIDLRLSSLGDNDLGYAQMINSQFFAKLIDPEGPFKMSVEAAIGATDAVFKSVRRGEGGVPRLSLNALSKVGLHAYLENPSEFMNGIPENLSSAAKAVIYKNFVEGVATVGEGGAFAESALLGDHSYLRRVNKGLLNLGEHLQVEEQLAEKFHLGKPFTPQEEMIEPAIASHRYHVVPTSAPTLSEWWAHPIKSLSRQFHRGFGLPEFAMSLIDEGSPMGSVAQSLNILLQMPERLAGPIGLGLGPEDRATALRYVTAVALKRVLPLYMGYEAYKNVNAELHEAKAPGLDDMAANLLANANLAAAKIKDAMGFTPVAQYIVSAVPGLDQYFSPRSIDEYREYLFYGEEEVRANRGWLLGTRNPILGTGAQYFRPNFFRRWKSHWTEAENVGLADPSISWMPSLTHPLAPLENILEGGRTRRWMYKHLKDRPYIGGGGPQPNQEEIPGVDPYYELNVPEGTEGVMAIMSGGGGYPISLKGGGGALTGGLMGSIPQEYAPYFDTGYMGGRDKGAYETGAVGAGPGGSPFRSSGGPFSGGGTSSFGYGSYPEGSASAAFVDKWGSLPYNVSVYGTFPATTGYGRAFSAFDQAIQDSFSNTLFITQGLTGRLSDILAYHMPYFDEERKYGMHYTGLPMEERGEPIRMEYHKTYPLEAAQAGRGMLDPVMDLAFDSVEKMRSMSGLYGGLMQMASFIPDDPRVFRRQDPGAAISFGRQMWMGQHGDLLGPIGEYFRRFIGPETQDFDAFNPFPNNMPTWLPAEFRTGDPYMRVPGIGELVLPGDAFERTHPWVRPLKVRGSMIGFTEEELIRKWLYPTEPVESERAEDILDFGSEAHKQVQYRLNRMGQLVGAEVSIVDEEHNLTGTIDAIIRGQTGEEIVEIKTQGSKNWGEVPEKYIDQLTFYMATTGIRRGHLAFVNRDNPQQVRFHTFDFDPERWARILDRIESARARVRDMVERGVISPYETYDLLGRIEVLSNVAPDSNEFAELARYAVESGGMGGAEKARLKQALKRAERLRNPLHLYPIAYSAPLETKKVRLEAITDEGELVTDMGTVRLAGVEFDPQAFAYKTAEEVLASYGLLVGDEISITLVKGQFNENLMNDTTLAAIVGGVNRKLIQSKIAKPKLRSNNPLDIRVVHGDGTHLKFLEWFLHTDNMITNKFLRVRTPLQQLKRGEVYGTDRSKWKDPVDTFVKPTARSIASKNPINAFFQGGVIGSLFFKSRKTKLKAFLAMGLLSSAASIGRMTHEMFKGDAWIPHHVKKQQEFDEYWDIIEYLKWTGIAEHAKKMAKKKEHIDIDKYMSGEAPYGTYGLGRWGTLAIMAERRARRTMYGFDYEHGSLEDALAALPKRHRQIAQEIILTGSMKEKNEFYDLISDPERRVLAKFLGTETDIPFKPNLNEYFKHHYLPAASWRGWNMEVSTEDLQERAAWNENLKVQAPNRAKAARARLRTYDVPIPKMDVATTGLIHKNLRAIISGAGFGGVDMHYAVRPSNKHIVNVQMEVDEDRSAQLHDMVRKAYSH